MNKRITVIVIPWKLILSVNLLSVEFFSTLQIEGNFNFNFNFKFLPLYLSSFQPQSNSSQKIGKEVESLQYFEDEFEVLAEVCDSSLQSGRRYFLLSLMPFVQILLIAGLLDNPIKFNLIFLKVQKYLKSYLLFRLYKFKYKFKIRLTN